MFYYTKINSSFLTTYQNLIRVPNSPLGDGLQFYHIDRVFKIF